MSKSRYSVNRLRVDGVCQSLVLLCRVEGGVEAGIALGHKIEDRGTTKARWSFVGQVEHDRRDLETLSGSAGISDERLLIHGVDVRHLTF